MTRSWTDVKQIPSSTGNVWKYVFENASAVAESVLYRYPDFASRTVICCSTQSGCPVGCRFWPICGKFVIATRTRLAVETALICSWPAN